jgi:hypothetical protein
MKGKAPIATAMNPKVEHALQRSSSSTFIGMWEFDVRGPTKQFPNFRKEVELQKADRSYPK